MKKTKKALVSALLATSIAVGSVPLTSTGNFEVSAASTQQEDKLITYAKSLKGTPYKTGGITIKGFDTSGYVQHVYQKFEVNLPRTSSDMFKSGQKTTALQPGDLVFYDTKNKVKKEASFVGIYLGNQQFIGVSVKNGVSIQSMNTSYWKTKYMGATKAPLIGNEFSLNKVKSGDVISGMKIDSVLLTDTELPSHVIFEGTATISGNVMINPKAADAYTFVPDQTSLKKLPAIVNKKGSALITFDDQAAARKILGKVKNKQKATITIDNYVISFKGNTVWKTAQVKKLVK